MELGVCGAKKKAGDFTELATKWILTEVQVFKPDVFVADWMPPALYASKWLKNAGISCIASLRSEDPFLWSLMDIFASKKFPSWAVCGVVPDSRGFSFGRYHRERILDFLDMGICLNCCRTNLRTKTRNIFYF